MNLFMASKLSLFVPLLLVAGLLCLFVVYKRPSQVQSLPQDVGAHSFLPKKNLESQVIEQPHQNDLTLKDSDPFGNKKFIYLTQIEGCLNNYLSSPDVIGDPEICQCDVIVLSFKNKCTTNSLKHVKYLFNSSTSWTTGRNLLYKAAIERDRQYMYYHFFDDDVRIEFNDTSKAKTSNAWRDYELSLLKLEPLFAVSWRKVIDIMPNYYLGKCSYPEPVDFLPYTWCDAIFNSFHYKAVRHLLPYYDQMDSITIWYSQLYLLVKSNIMFPGQIMLSLNSHTENYLHRPYKKVLYTGETVRQFLPDLKKEIPAKYLKQLEPVLQSWVDNMYGYQFRYYNRGNDCPPFPEVDHQAIPYSYLDKEI